MAHSSPSDLPLLVQRTVARLIRAFAPERIVLFGSYAKGAVHAASDVDLLVVSNLQGNPIAHQRRARQLAVPALYSWQRHHHLLPFIDLRANGPLRNR